MSVVALRTKAGKRGERRVAAARGATARGAAYAKAQVHDLTNGGRRLAQGVDGQVKQVTGKRSAAWIDDAAALVRNHLGIAFTVAALALFLLLV